MGSVVVTKLFELPVEIWNIVLQDTDLETIKSLRLASKLLALKCLGPSFLKFVKCEYTTDLSKEGLRFLEYFASHPQIGPRVRDVTIISRVYGRSAWQEHNKSSNESDSNEKQLEYDYSWPQTQHGEDDNVSEESAIESLTAAFTNFACLRTLKLDGTLVRGPGKTESLENGSWQSIRLGALRTYRRTISAIFRSGLTVKNLVIYRETPCCFITLCDLKAHTDELMVEYGVSARGRASIERLALSVSATMKTNVDVNGTAEKSRATNDSHACDNEQRIQSIFTPAEFPDDDYDGVANFLALMPGLLYLDLHLYPVSIEEEDLSRAKEVAPKRLSLKEKDQAIPEKAAHERLSRATAEKPANEPKEAASKRLSGDATERPRAASLPRVKKCLFSRIRRKEGSSIVRDITPAKDITSAKDITPAKDSTPLKEEQPVKAAEFMYDMLFEAIAKRPVMLPRLEKCFFRGMYMKKDSILQFLAEHRNLNHLKLERVVLTSGCSWAPIFHFLSGKSGSESPREMPLLKKLDLSYLWNWRFVLANLTYTWEIIDKFSSSTMARENRFELAQVDWLVVHTRHFNGRDLDGNLNFRPAPLQIKYGIQTPDYERNEWRNVELI